MQRISQKYIKVQCIEAVRGLSQSQLGIGALLGQRNYINYFKFYQQV